MPKRKNNEREINMESIQRDEGVCCGIERGLESLKYYDKSSEFYIGKY